MPDANESLHDLAKAAIAAYMRQAVLDLVVARTFMVTVMRDAAQQYGGDPEGSTDVRVRLLKLFAVSIEEFWYRPLVGNVTVDMFWKYLSSSHAHEVRGCVDTLVLGEEQGRGCGDHPGEVALHLNAALGTDCNSMGPDELLQCRQQAHDDAVRAAIPLIARGVLASDTVPQAPLCQPYPTLVQWLKAWAPKHCAYLDALEAARVRAEAISFKRSGATAPTHDGAAPNGRTAAPAGRGGQQMHFREVGPADELSTIRDELKQHVAGRDTTSMVPHNWEDVYHRRLRQWLSAVYDRPDLRAKLVGLVSDWLAMTRERLSELGRQWDALCQSARGAAPDDRTLHEKLDDVHRYGHVLCQFDEGGRVWPMNGRAEERCKSLQSCLSRLVEIAPPGAGHDFGEAVGAFATDLAQTKWDIVDCREAELAAAAEDMLLVYFARFPNPDPDFGAAVFGGPAAAKWAGEFVWTVWSVHRLADGGPEDRPRIFAEEIDRLTDWLLAEATMHDEPQAERKEDRVPTRPLPPASGGRVREDIIEGINGLTTLWMLLDCTMELLIRHPEQVDPAELRFPKEQFEADVLAELEALRQDAPAIEEHPDFKTVGPANMTPEKRQEIQASIDHVLRVQAEHRVKTRSIYLRAEELDWFRAKMLRQFAFWYEGASPVGSDEAVPFDEVLRRVQKAMERHHLDVTQRLAEDPPWGHRADLLPRGATLRDQYEDYQTTRRLILHCLARSRGRLGQMGPRYAGWDHELIPDPVPLPDDVCRPALEEEPQVEHITPPPAPRAEDGSLDDNPNLIRLTAAATAYNIPKSVLSRCANETQPGKPRLTKLEEGGKVYLKREEVRRLQIARETLRGKQERADD